ncbi:signal peptidase I [Curtobacterium sp. RRHDQ10]|uniref:signal peptidase I n=1 Tax=Curtobacterium phyllosphaerae TaxID=3413379 RepID=UPI003BF00E25
MTRTARLRRRTGPAAVVALVVLLRATALTVACLALWAAVPAVVGWIPTTVVTGSMSPRIQVGDVVVSMPVDGDDARTGQVVLVDHPVHADTLLLHRVHEVTDDGLRLKGDANPRPDGRIVRTASVHGVGVLRVPLVGLPTVWVHEHRWGAVGLGVLAATGLVAGIALTRRLVGPESDPAARTGHLTSRRPRSLRRAAAMVGIVVTGALVVSSVSTLAGATVVWAGSTSSDGNRLGTDRFDCMAHPLGEPWFHAGFGEASGSELRNDGIGAMTAFLGGGAVRVDGSCVANPYGSFNGTNALVTTWEDPGSHPAPDTFTIETWFRTTSAQGKLVGYGEGQTRPSRSYDRHLYIGGDGHLRFGVFNGVQRIISSPQPVTDGRWHHVAATIAAGEGMRMYLDGDLVGTDPNDRGQVLDGWWRIGYDTVNGWGGASGPYFRGDLDDVAIHLRSITAAEVTAHAAAGR